MASRVGISPRVIVYTLSKSMWRSACWDQGRRGIKYSHSPFSIPPAPNTSTTALTSTTDNSFGPASQTVNTSKHKQMLVGRRHSTCTPDERPMLTMQAQPHMMLVSLPRIPCSPQLRDLRERRTRVSSEWVEGREPIDSDGSKERDDIGPERQSDLGHNPGCGKERNESPSGHGAGNQEWC